MAIPDYQSLMLPLLRFAEDGKEHSLSEAVEHLVKEFKLTQDEKNEHLSSGQQVIFNRVGWARTYLSKSGILESKKRGFFNITNRGREVLLQNPSKVNNTTLKQFPEFLEFQNIKREKNVQNEPDISEDRSRTPEESLETSYQTILNALATEILDKVKSCSPNFFERLVVGLLVKMGYGGTLQDAAGEILGKSGDGGVDGVIKEDRLGLDVIYIQAKRWEGTVSSSAIRDFAGALLQKKARKGVFITTSNFTTNAKTFVKDIESTGSKIILINGEELAELMIDYNVGVSVATTYEIKKIDSDYFSED